MAAPVTIILSGAVRKEQACRDVMRAPGGSVVEIHRPKRTLPQNSLLHAAITDFARQVAWPPGSGIKRDTEAWKDIFTAGYRSAKHGLDVVPGLNGGFVLLGMHTSGMSKVEMIDLIDFVYATGAEYGVVFSEPAPTQSPTAKPGAEAVTTRQSVGEVA